MIEAPRAGQETGKRWRSARSPACRREGRDGVKAPAVLSHELHMLHRHPCWARHIHVVRPASSSAKRTNSPWPLNGLPVEQFIGHSVVRRVSGSNPK
jgi:hypothetical protein